MKDVTFLLPAYNEEKSIAVLLDNINRLYPNSKILVVDNNSTDLTPRIAEERGAEVIYEKKQGKGHAVRKGFRNFDTEYLVMLDADNTYSPEDAINLIKPLMEDKADIVLGCRMNGNMEKGAITKFNIIGNYMLSFIASILYSKVTDVCTGYWAFKRETVNCLLKENINSDGFELEVEMFIKASKMNLRILEKSISYRKRTDMPKLNSVGDGWRIFKTLWSYKI